MREKKILWALLRLIATLIQLEDQELWDHKAGQNS